MIELPKEMVLYPTVVQLFVLTRMRSKILTLHSTDTTPDYGNGHCAMCGEIYPCETVQILEDW